MLEGSVLAGWLHCGLACSKAEASGQKGVVDSSCSPLGSQEAEPGKRGPSIRYRPRGHGPMPYSFSQAPLSLRHLHSCQQIRSYQWAHQLVKRALSWSSDSPDPTDSHLQHSEPLLRTCILGPHYDSSVPPGIPHCISPSCLRHDSSGSF